MQEERESDIRESTNDQNNDERYTQVDNDVFNNIEGYEKKKEEENDENPGETNPGETIEKVNQSTISNSSKKENKKLKIILLGEKAVGKSSIINRYVSNKFNTFNQTSIGPDVKSKKYVADKDLTVDLLIHDSTNEQKLGKFTKNYYLDAHGAIIVFDLTNQQSFQKVKYWLDELNSNAPRDIIFCILGNKADLTADRVVKFEDAKALAEDNLYYEVSAKTGNNVTLAFEQLALGIIEKQKEEENNPDKVLRGKEGRKTADLNDINKDLTKKKKCC
jgi:small GTP-binding protein